MNEITRLTIQTALQKMLEGGHFSICTIDSVLKLTGGIPDKEVYNHLSTLHCVNFRDMPVELRRVLPEMINSVVCSEGMEVTFAPKASTLPAIISIEPVSSREVAQPTLIQKIARRFA